MVATEGETPQVFRDLPGWRAADFSAGVAAFRRSCSALDGRTGSLNEAADARWAGRVSDWKPICDAVERAGDADAVKALITRTMVPVEILEPDGSGGRFTGYFEPLIEARRQPGGEFTAPVPGPPADLVVRDGTPYQRTVDGRLRAYPPRAEIVPDPARVLGYAHPADVFFLQIQGSGRLRFPDGETVRAAYYATNGQPFRSTANWLLERGWISRGEASMQGIRAWMDRAAPSQVRAAMNANPRYVFFQAKPQGDADLGPEGAAGIPLTPLGSIAVDPSLHALGVPYFVETEAPGLGGRWQGLLVAQDTGAAIKGAVRGDLYFGTGAAAGERAGTMNAPGRMWVLLPRAVAERLRAAGV